jgi:hypothetical protein
VAFPASALIRVPYLGRLSAADSPMDGGGGPALSSAWARRWWRSDGNPPDGRERSRAAEAGR